MSNNSTSNGKSDIINVNTKLSQLLKRLNRIVKYNLDIFYDAISTEESKKDQWYNVHSIKKIDIKLANDIHSNLIDLISIMTNIVSFLDVYDQDLLYFYDLCKSKIEELLLYVNLSGETVISEYQIKRKILVVQHLSIKFLGICKMIFNGNIPNIDIVNYFIDNVINLLIKESINNVEHTNKINALIFDIDDFWIFSDVKIVNAFYRSYNELLDFFMQYYVFVRNLPFKSMFEISDIVNKIKEGSKRRKKTKKKKSKEDLNDESIDNDNNNDTNIINDFDNGEIEEIKKLNKNKLNLFTDIKTNILDNICKNIQLLKRVSFGIEKNGSCYKAPSDLLYECELLNTTMNEFIGFADYLKEYNYVKKDYILEDIIEIFADRTCLLCRNMFKSAVWEKIKQIATLLNKKIKIYDSSASEISLNRKIGLFDIERVPTMKWKNKTMWLNPVPDANIKVDNLTMKDKYDPTTYSTLLREIESFFDIVGTADKIKAHKISKITYKDKRSKVTAKSKKTEKPKISKIKLRRLNNEYAILSLFNNDPNKELPKYKLKQVLQDRLSNSTINSLIKKMRDENKIILSRTTDEGVVLYKLGIVDMREYEPIILKTTI